MLPIHKVLCQQLVLGIRGQLVAVVGLGAGPVGGAIIHCIQIMQILNYCKEIDIDIDIERETEREIYIYIHMGIYVEGSAAPGAKPLRSLQSFL